MQHFADWDHDDELEKERRLQERRQRVQERLAAQKQGASLAGDGAGDAVQHPGQKGRHEAQLSQEAVRQLREQCDAAAAAVRDAAEAREEARREQWGQQEGWLREEIASEAEACKAQARAVDLEWEAVHNAATPQEAHAAMLAVQAHCDQVLQSKDDLIAGIQAVLRERDEAYVRLLQSQTEETDTLIALMARDYDRFRRGQEQGLEAVEAAYLQERNELISSNKAELDALLEKRSGLEQGFMDQYLKACEAYEAQLEAMRVAEAEEYTALKRRLEGEVASLEAHLDSMRSVYMLNADKLQYNVRVLSERERENKEALQQQKRKVTRQWEVLSKLKKRFAEMDKRFTEENLRLADEYQRVTRAFNHLQTKYRHFKAADLRRFNKIQAMKEEELEALVDQLAEVNAGIRQHVLGLPAEQTGASTVPSEAAGMAVVGRAVTASAETPVSGADALVARASIDNEAEVVALSSEEAAQRRQLISAHWPGAEEAEGGAACVDVGAPVQAVPAGSPRAAAAGCEIPPLARQELRESLETGMLSLLVGGSGGQVDSGKLLRLLEQLPEAAPGRCEVDCVVRGLGVQHNVTRQALGRLLRGGGEGTAGPAVAGGEEAAAEALQLVGVEEVRRGLQHLLGMLQAEVGSRASPAAAGGQPGNPTSTAYWQQRVEAVLPPEVFKTWALLEPQLVRQFKLLKSRSRAAEEVAALEAENEALKGRLKELLTSPANAEMQLPTKILLQ